MAPRRTTEAILERLSRLRSEPATALTVGELRRGLGHRSPAVVTRCATLSAELELGELLDVLHAAYERLRDLDTRSDPGCRAKTALATTLDRLDTDDDSPFVHGIRHRQMEPVFGGRVDTAAELRGVCAHALAARRHPDVLILLADLLADPEALARSAAARALGASGRPHALPLLRLRVLVGDEEPEVLTDCLTSMLHLEPHGTSFDFVCSRLESPLVEHREAAALALGESRLPEAFTVLKQWWDGLLDHDEQRTALLALAVLRTQPALDLLLDLVEFAPVRTALEALEALRLYRGDQRVENLVRAAARKRGQIEVTRAVESTF